MKNEAENCKISMIQRTVFSGGWYTDWHYQLVPDCQMSLYLINSSTALTSGYLNMYQG